MATTKKITNAQLLAAAAELLANLSDEEFAEKAPNAAAEFTREEHKEKADKMHETATKKKEVDPNAPKPKTKTQRENEGLAVKAHEAMLTHGEPVGSQWIMEHVQYITSTQKVTSVMKVAAALGLVESTKDEKGKAMYRPIA